MASNFNRYKASRWNESLKKNKPQFDHENDYTASYTQRPESPNSGTYDTGMHAVFSRTPYSTSRWNESLKKSKPLFDHENDYTASYTPNSGTYGTPLATFQKPTVTSNRFHNPQESLRQTFGHEDRFSTYSSDSDNGEMRGAYSRTSYSTPNRWNGIREHYQTNFDNEGYFPTTYVQRPGSSYSGIYGLWKGTGNTNEIRMVFIGKTGSGKSATGNTLLGGKYFDSETSAASLTKKCACRTAERFGKNLVVVDTPGLFDTKMSEDQVMMEIIKCILMSSPGPHSFALVLSIASKFTNEEQKTVEKFEDLFGQEMYNHLIILFTRRDDFERENTNLQEHIKKAPEELQALVKKCSGRCLAINNVQEWDMRERDAKEIIKLTTNVIKDNKGTHYSTGMYVEAEKQYLARAEEMKRKANMEKEIEKMKIEREIKAKYQRKIEIAESEREEADREKREYENKVGELERKRDIAERQAENKRIRNEADLYKLKAENKEHKLKITELEKRKETESEKLDAEKEKREQKAKIEALEEQLAKEEKQRQKDRQEFEKDRDELTKKLGKAKKKKQEAREKEITLNKEKTRDEEQANKTVESKYKTNDAELRQDFRKNVEEEKKEVFRPIFNGLVSIGTGLANACNNVLEYLGTVFWKTR